MSQLHPPRRPCLLFPLQRGPGPLSRETLIRSLLVDQELPPGARAALLGVDGPRLTSAWQGMLAGAAEATMHDEACLLQVERGNDEERPAAALPLLGKRVLVTRTLDEATAAAWQLGGRGAEAIVLPCLEIRPVADEERAQLQLALRQAARRYDIVVVTSLNGARALGQALQEAGLAPRTALAGLLIASVGPRTTAELDRLGLPVDLTTPDHRAEGLIAALLEQGRAGPCRALLPRAAEARELLPRALVEAGWTVDDLPAYRTEWPQLDLTVLGGWIAEVGLDAALFASPSAFHGFLALLGHRQALDILGRTAICAIGPTTATALRAAGLEVAAMPAVHTMAALIEAAGQLLAGGSWWKSD
ncbi:MAG: uroporphyrinogen-III synthase [Deltaproteobacteria bacterium]|nr:uroporphyrinogen-III synthase [Deltaproteobacteria bacterium]